MGNDGDEFLFLTNLQAPKHQVIQINVNDENREWDNYDVIVEVSKLCITTYYVDEEILMGITVKQFVSVGDS